MDKLCLPLLWVSGAMLGVLVVAALTLRVAERMAELLGDLGAAALARQSKHDQSWSPGTIHAPDRTRRTEP